MTAVLQSQSLRMALFGLTAILLGLGLALRLSMYDRFLPYIDYSDEVVYVAYSDHIRGMSDQTALIEKYGTLQGLYVFMTMLIQTLHDVFKGHDYAIIAEYYPLLRLASVFFSLGTAALLCDVGRLMGGWLAGLLAAAAWAFSPNITAHDMLALPDSLFFLTCAFTWWAGVRAWMSRSPRWLMVSLLAAIAAIYTKLWLLTIVVSPVLLALLIYRARPFHWGWWAAYVLVSLLSAVNFWINFRLLSLPDRPFFADRLWNVERILNNTYHLFAPLGPTRDAAWTWGITWLIAGAAAWGLARWRGWRTVPLIYVGLLGLFLLFSLPLSSPVSYVAMGAGWRLRHILPLGIAALALWGLAAQQIAWLIEDGLGRWRATARGWLAAPLVFLACTVPLLSWWIQGNRELIDTFAKPHLVNRVTYWSDVNLPEEGDSLTLFPLESSLASLWERYWGAYAGSRPHWYFSEPMETIRASNPTELMARNFRYIIVDSQDIVRAGGEARWQAFLGDAARLVKTFAPHPDFHDRLTRKPETPLTAYVYRLGNFDQTIEQTWGGQLRLLGLDWWTDEGHLDSTSPHPGDNLSLRLFWAREATPTANYSVFVHLYPIDREEVLAQVDGPPAQPQRPTLTWDDPDEMYISEPLVLTLPNDLAPGDYRLVLGVYDYLTMQRLALPDGSTYVSLPLRVG
ncbi:MAG: hypothetical protein NZ750_12800 [Anaerolineae bacterium]|nr:hypothetical protein [Anaerolineae bacterium]MDW8173654.1 hypothetical protein [Anaerolineae bacterium]